MNGLVRDVGVEFLGEVVVFALHLISEVVDAGVYLPAHIAKPRIDSGV